MRQAAVFNNRSKGGWIADLVIESQEIGALEGCWKGNRLVLPCLTQIRRRIRQVWKLLDEPDRMIVSQESSLEG